MGRPPVKPQPTSNSSSTRLQTYCILITAGLAATQNKARGVRVGELVPHCASVCVACCLFFFTSSLFNLCLCARLAPLSSLFLLVVSSVSSHRVRRRSSAPFTRPEDCPEPSVATAFLARSSQITRSLYPRYTTRAFQ